MKMKRIMVWILVLTICSSIVLSVDKWTNYQHNQNRQEGTSSSYTITGKELEVSTVNITANLIYYDLMVYPVAKDMNSNGRPELFYTTSDHSIRVIESTGSNTYTILDSYSNTSLQILGQMVIDDIDLDGDDELMFLATIGGSSNPFVMVYNWTNNSLTSDTIINLSDASSFYQIGDNSKTSYVIGCSSPYQINSTNSYTCATSIGGKIFMFNKTGYEVMYTFPYPFPDTHSYNSIVVEDIDDDGTQEVCTCIRSGSNPGWILVICVDSSYGSPSNDTFVTPLRTMSSSEVVKPMISTYDITYDSIKEIFVTERMERGNLTILDFKGNPIHSFVGSYLVSYFVGQYTTGIEALYQGDAIELWWDNSGSPYIEVFDFDFTKYTTDYKSNLGTIKSLFDASRLWHYDTQLGTNEEVINNKGVFHTLINNNETWTFPIINFSKMGFNQPDFSMAFPLDFNGDFATDFIYVEYAKLRIVLNGYSNVYPQFDSVYCGTGIPICLNHSMTYQVTFTDVDNELGRIGVYCANETGSRWSGWSSYSTSPSATCNYTTLMSGVEDEIILQDSNGNNATQTAKVYITVSLSGCYETGYAETHTCVYNIAGLNATTAEEIYGINASEVRKMTQRGTTGYYSKYFDYSKCEDWKVFYGVCMLWIWFEEGIMDAGRWVLTSFKWVIILVAIAGIFYMVASKREMLGRYFKR